MYIAGLGMFTPVGANTEMTTAAIDAGVSAYKDSGYFTKTKDPIKMAQVPTDALAELSDELKLHGMYGRWEQHLLQLAGAAIQEAMGEYEGDPVPIVLAAPEHYQQWPHQLPENFLQNLIKQSGSPIDLTHSRTVQVGRAGAIEALQTAERFLFEANQESVLIGGVDSYQRPELFRGLLEYGRINVPGNKDGFVPGEGAAFILVTKNKEKALVLNDHSVFVTAPSTWEETAHLYSSEPGKGEGLDKAVKGALQNYNGPNIGKVFSTHNGEAYWSKELGVMLTRNNSRMSEDVVVEHPADCLGDMGAASSAGLIVLAAMDLLKNKAYTSHLTCASSDHQHRAAVLLSVDMQAA